MALTHTLLSAFSLRRNIKQLFIRPPAHIPLFDGFRALILVVIIFHSCSMYVVFHPQLELIALIENNAWATWFWNSDKSLDVFFMASGFLITGILLHRIDRQGKLRLANFYARRYLRLSPAYWIAAIIYVALHFPHSRYIWANIFYVNNFLPYGKHAMNWTWSLAIEEQFYLVFPLVLLILTRYTKKPVLGLWGLLVLSFVIRGYVILSDDLLCTTPLSRMVMDGAFHEHYFSVLYDNFHTRYVAILCGCMAAFYHVRMFDKLRTFVRSNTGMAVELLSYAAIIMVLSLPVMDRGFDTWHRTRIIYLIVSRGLFSAAVAYVSLACIEQSRLSLWVRVFFSLRIWYPLAQLSYSMYLLHVMIIVFLVHLAIPAVLAMPESLAPSPFKVMCFLSLYSTILSILGAVIIYLVIERPIMNLRAQ